MKGTVQTSVRRGLLRPLRKLGLSIASRWPWPVRARIKSGREMFVDLRSGVGRGLFMTGEFDPVVFDAFRRVLKPGGVFVDVGANVGYYSMLALDLVGDSGQVHAFEIDVRPIRCLRKTVRRFGLTNLVLHQVAVGDRVGEAVLNPDPDCGESSVSRSGGGRQVRMTTLDEWWRTAKCGRVQGVKLDIEGGEFAALQGAPDFLEANRPLVVCEVFAEYRQRTGRDPNELTDFLRSLDYDVEILSGGWSPGLVATPRRLAGEIVTVPND